MLLAVSSLTLLFRRFQGDPPAHGPAKNTQSLAVLIHLFHFALPNGDNRLSFSVIVCDSNNMEEFEAVSMMHFGKQALFFGAHEK